MSDDQREVVVLLASREELPAGHTWGTGGWLPPVEREALDWLTLARLLGWSVRVASESGAEPEGGIGAGNRFVIVGRDPDTLSDELVALIAARLESESLLVVTARAQRSSSDRAAGRRGAQGGAHPGPEDHVDRTGERAGVDLPE
jgi:hypothetical protein